MDFFFITVLRQRFKEIEWLIESDKMFGSMRVVVFVQQVSSFFQMY